MRAPARFLTVIASGALLSAAATVLVWPFADGPAATALALASAVALMTALDNRLAGRPQTHGKTGALAVVGGATAWVMLRWLAG